ncbi:MAG: 2-succinyl-5-enolpyruvyl-6-hydroxy-3-cyclohexene-1-carboxylate synthase, partial [Pseudolysinimonas sp.]
LLAGDREPRPRMQVIVGNDGGGTIFDSLEVAATADPELVDRVLLTPQTVDLAALAAAYGWEYRRVAARGELEPALTPTPGRVLIEVPLARA